MSSNNLNFWRRNWILRTIITVKSWIKHQPVTNILRNCHPRSLHDSAKKYSRSWRHFTTLSKRSIIWSMSRAATVAQQIIRVFTSLKLFMSSDDLDWEYTLLPLLSHPLLLSPGLIRVCLYSKVVTPRWSASLIHQCYNGGHWVPTPTYTDVNVKSIIVLMAPSDRNQPADIGSSLNTSSGQTKDD